MKDDIKQKFLDILFEPDKNDSKEPKKDVKEEVVVKKENVALSAKDILYRKPKEQSAFINLKETSQKNNDFNISDEGYEFSSQISPIFGVIKDANNKKNKEVKKTDEELVTKPQNTRLGIVFSPIYGYGKKTEENINVDENELHRIFEKEDEQKSYDENQINLFDEYKEN